MALVSLEISIRAEPPPSRKDTAPCLCFPDAGSRPRYDRAMILLRFILVVLLAALQGRTVLAFENLALRQQLAVLRRSVKRPKIAPRDRAFWIALSHSWSAWKSALIIVKPQAVVRWHRAGFLCFWRWRS